MNKKKLLAMLKRKQNQRAALVAKSNSTEDVQELRSILSEIDDLDVDIRETQEMIDEIEEEERSADDNGDPAAEERSQEEGGAEKRDNFNVMGTYASGMSEEARQAVVKQYDTDGANLRNQKSINVSMVETQEERAVTIGASNLVVQKKYSNTLNETFNEVSSLIDRVNAVPLMGGESYTKGFEVSFAEGDYTTETGDYTEGDPVTDYVEIGKAKITAYTEITDEATKLPNIDYRALVVKNVRIAIRKKITKQLLIGAGGANAITGIFNAPTNVIPAASDIDIADIDADTLDDIILGYGGDEDVEGEAVLIINKKTLKNFAKVRSTDGKKLYKITIDRNGNTGTISSEDSWNVPYILNSAVAGFDDVVEDAYFGAYGKLEAYEMPVFSQLTIQESRDFKFKSGQIAYRGVILAGGNVVSYKGFARLKKNAVA